MKSNNILATCIIILLTTCYYSKVYSQSKKSIPICFFSNSMTLDRSGMIFSIPTEFILYTDSLIMSDPNNLGKNRIFYFKDSIDYLPNTKQTNLSNFELNKQVYYYNSKPNKNSYITAQVTLNINRKGYGTLCINTNSTKLIYQIMKDEYGE